MFDIENLSFLNYTSFRHILKTYRHWTLNNIIGESMTLKFHIFMFSERTTK